MKLNEFAGSWPHTRPVLKLTFYGWALTFVLALAFTPGTAMAQLPIMIIDDAGVFEGNSGTTILKLPVRFVGTQNQMVTGVVSAIPLTGAGFNTPTGGAQCGGSVDFQPFSEVPFTILPNTPNGTLTVNITICGNATIEPDEQIFVSFSRVVGADCTLEGTCNGVGTIINDDGPPSIRINDITVSTLKGLQRSATFTVSLHHPSSSPVSVHFATRDGTAKAVGGFFAVGSYFATSGTLTIPPDTPTGTIPVTITGRGSGTFFMDLSTPVVNGTLFDATGKCTIELVTLTVGSFDIAPANARVQVGDRIDYSVTWTVPEGEVWRNLNSLDLRLKKGNQIPLWLRWDEVANTFSVCGGDPDNPICTAGDLPGSPNVLETPLAQVYLSDSRVVGSGPTGRSVTLNLSIAFRDKAAGHLYDVEVAATDDFGRKDDFVRATTVNVEKAGKQ